MRRARLDRRVAVGGGEPLVRGLDPAVAAVEGEVDPHQADPEGVGSQREIASPGRGRRLLRAGLRVHQVVPARSQDVRRGGVDRQRRLVLAVPCGDIRRAPHAHQGARACLRCRGRRVGGGHYRGQCPHHAADRGQYQKPPFSSYVHRASLEICQPFAAIVVDGERGRTAEEQATIGDGRAQNWERGYRDPRVPGILVSGQQVRPCTGKNAHSSDVVTYQATAPTMNDKISAS